MSQIESNLQSAIDGSQQAYEAIVALPPAEMITYFETKLPDAMKNLPEDIFGFGSGYDVRGNAQPIKGGVVDLTPANLCLIGKLMGTHHAAPGDKVLLTGDIRLHTPILRYCLALGIASVGVNVEYAPDYLTTGAHNLLATDNAGNYKFMIQVSGSHGPAQKNGFKIKADLTGSGILQPLYAEKLEELYKHRNVVREGAAAGSLTRISGLEEYVVDTLNKTLPETLSDEIVVVDPRSGAAGLIVTALFKKRGFVIIDMDTVSEQNLTAEIARLWAAGNRRIAVMLNKQPDGTMSRGIWDPSLPEALEPTQRLVTLINANLTKDMPRAFGGVFDGDADRISAVLEDGTAVPAFEMTLPYYQRFLIDRKNQQAMVSLAKSGAPAVKIVCDVRANSKLLSLVDTINAKLQKEAGVRDRNIVEGYFITTGYPPQLGFMRNRIAELEAFVAKKPELKSDAAFMQNFENLKRTYFTAEASGHNFFHISERYPYRVCDCAISGFFTIMNIRQTMSDYEAHTLGLKAGKARYDLVELFAGFPPAYSSREVTVAIPNNIKIETAKKLGAWMKERYSKLLKPYNEPCREDDYLVQSKDDGFVTVSGFKVQLTDGRTALVRWSNTSEKLTTIFEGRDLAGLICIVKEVTARMKQEGTIDITPLEKEIARLEALAIQDASDGVAKKLHTPLAGDEARSAEFLKGGYNQNGYGVPAGAAIDGSFAIDAEGSQGYYVYTGKETFLSTVAAMKDLFKRRAARLGKPLRYVIKPGIGGQHTPFEAIATVFNVIDSATGTVVGEYELGKDYEAAMASTLKRLCAGWDQVCVIPSSKSGSTDETMLIFTDIFFVLLKNVAAMHGVDGVKFASVVFDTMHDINFVDGVERPGKDLFKGFNLALVADNAKRVAGIEKVTYDIVKAIFGTVLGNMFFETTDRPSQSRLSAFIRNSGLDKELGEDTPGFGAMFDNVGGRWTADLHMMTFLAYYDLDSQAYWNTRYAGIKAVRSGAHRANKLAANILNEGITDIALIVPEELFWFGKAIEQNFNESIWQKGFANLIAIRDTDWDYQKRYYTNKTKQMVVALSGPGAAQDAYNAVNLGFPRAADLGKQALAEMMGELFTTFYGLTHTVGNALIARALAREGFVAADVDISDLDNPATRILQQNLYLRQPFVELGKNLLEGRLKALQKSGPRAIAEEFGRIEAMAVKVMAESCVPGVSIPPEIADVKALSVAISGLVRSAGCANRKLVPFIYLEDAKFRELRDHLVCLGVEWVMQGTGDQHISYQQVLAQPQRYLPCIISFVPFSQKAIAGHEAIGFAKGYLNNVSPHMARDLFAEASYGALKERSGIGVFMRMSDTQSNRSMLKGAFTEAFLSRTL